MDDKKIVGESIRKLRTDNGFTQVQIAKSLGISTATLSSYERGITAPPMQIICNIAKFFNVSVDVVLGPDPGKENPFSCWMENNSTDV